MRMGAAFGPAEAPVLRDNFNVTCAECKETRAEARTDFNVPF